MNYRLFITILAILTVISTLCICITKPKLHKSVLVYSSEFQIVPQSELEVDVQNIPTVVQTTTTVPQSVKTVVIDDSGVNIQDTTSKNVNIISQTTKPQAVTTTTNKGVQTQNYNITTVQTKPQNVQYTVQSQNIKQVTPTTKIINTTPVQTKLVTKNPSGSKQINVNSPQLVTNNPQIDIQKILDNNKKFQTTNQQPVTVQPKIVNQTPTVTPTKITTAPVGTKIATIPATKTTVKTPEPVKVLTPQEEEIAWKIWRSNLQNKIMQDAKLPNVPQGTIFKFTFDVDKYGKISNVHTSCTNNSQYTPYAIQYIAPVIKSYQGRSILNFPEGSKRTTTSFVGSFKISNSSKYSTSGDYTDTERVTR